MDSTPPIAILTDFGSIDPFVGILKGVVTRLSPSSKLIDLSHNVPPGDILRGAMALWQARPFFPAPTVFLCVIDPGVGTARHGLYLQSQGSIYIGPDNGLFTFILDEEAQAWELTNQDLALSNASSTFHGRDIFAPAAAYAALGNPGKSFGPAVPDLVQLPQPRLEILENGAIQGEVLYPDHFGNLLTSLGRFLPTREGYTLHPWLPGLPSLNITSRVLHVLLPSGEQLSIATTFAEIEPNTCAGVIGSTGLLEIAANRSSAAEKLDLHGGEGISLELS